MTRPLTEADKAAFRDRMCDVAQARFSQQGYQAVTMRDLAAGMGVSSMTPYRYFKDKDQILAAVRTRAFTRLADAMDAAESELQERFTGNVEDAAHMCWTATHGVLVLELSGMLRPPVQARTIAMRAVDAIARGLNAPTHAAAG